MISKAIFIWGPKAPWLLFKHTYITLIRDSYKCNDIYRLFNAAQHLDNSAMYHFIKLLFSDAFWFYSGLLMQILDFFSIHFISVQKTVITAASSQFPIWRLVWLLPVHNLYLFFRKAFAFYFNFGFGLNEICFSERIMGFPLKFMSIRWNEFSHSLERWKDEQNTSNQLKNKTIWVCLTRMTLK